MTRFGGVVAAVLCAASAAVAQAPAAVDETRPLSHGLFDGVQVDKPAGPVRQFVMLLSGADGVAPVDRERARTLAAAGAMVATIDTPAFAARLAGEGGPCGYAAGAFENLARYVQAAYRLPGYFRPMLAGRGAGGALAYAVLAQGEPGSFGPALSAGFCPTLPYRLPMCAAHALPASVPASAASAPAAAAGSSRLSPAVRLAAPWVVLQPGGADAACTDAQAQAFVARVRGAQTQGVSFGAAYAQLAARNDAPKPVPADLADLPVVEVPTTLPGNRFAVLLSGDGGWAGIDKELAAALAKRGVPVAGFDSLRYFWRERTPQGLAADLDRLIRYYAARWGRQEVILIGYSQGADVLPFAVNRLDAASRARVKLTTLLSLGQQASFEFHVANWLGPSGDVPIAPEATKLDADETLCVYGTEDRESLCPSLAPAHARVVALPGGHHFDGDYDKLARIVLDHAPR